MEAYKPQPIDTSKVVLEKDLRLLGERLAEHLHDVWATNKIAQGYVYGETTSDGKDGAPKTHRDLKPYDDLPDEIQKYDRDSGMGAIKAIKALGWTLVPPDEKR
jgi:ryanodine receptor 2